MTELQLETAKKIEAQIKFYKTRIETIKERKEFEIIFNTFDGSIQDNKFLDHTICKPSNEKTSDLYHLVLDYYISKVEALEEEFERL